MESQFPSASMATCASASEFPPSPEPEALGTPTANGRAALVSAIVREGVHQGQSDRRGVVIAS